MQLEPFKIRNIVLRKYVFRMILCCHNRHGILLMLVIKTTVCIVSFKYNVGDGRNTKTNTIVCLVFR